jgi:hypothetical protein
MISLPGANGRVSRLFLIRFRSTPGCVYLAAMNRFFKDFKAVILEDYCAAYRPEIKETFLAALKMMLLEPLIRIMKLEEWLQVSSRWFGEY